MHILLTGADGLIGRHLLARLLAEGHRVRCVVREPARFVAPTNAEVAAMDFASAPGVAEWTPLLAGIDVVVNTVGIFRETATQRFRVIHGNAPMRLFDACVRSGVAYVIQVSALGADAQARSRFHLSKREADEHLRSLPLSAAIVQPSLVYAPAGASAALFNMLASLPLLALPRTGRVQPVHLDDVVEGMAALVRRHDAGVITLPFVGPSPLSLRDYLARLRQALGFRQSAPVLRLPRWIAMLGAKLAEFMHSRLLDVEALRMLLRDNCGPVEALSGLLGRPPRGIENFVAAREAECVRRRALMQWGLPLLRISLAIVWIWTGIVSLGLYPVEQSYVLLARTGIGGAAATVMLYGAALLDLLLGWLTLRCPAGARPRLWAFQLGLIMLYTLIISLRLPEYWLHPYGPVLKNLPMLAAIVVLWANDSAAQRR